MNENLEKINDCGSGKLIKLEISLKNNELWLGSLKLKIKMVFRKKKIRQ